MGEREVEFEYDDWQDCPECGGSGVDDRMCECQKIEDTCFCVIPKPVACDHCCGLGGWSLSDD